MATESLSEQVAQLERERDDVRTTLRITEGALTLERAKTAEAERRGAYKAIRDLAQNQSKFDIRAWLESVAETHYAAPREAQAVTHEAVRKAWPSLMELFDDAGKSLTYRELAALLALAAPQEGRTDA